MELEGSPRPQADVTTRPAWRTPATPRRAHHRWYAASSIDLLRETAPPRDRRAVPRDAGRLIVRGCGPKSASARASAAVRERAPASRKAWLLEAPGMRVRTAGLRRLQ